jgi:hypothetical protein
VNEVDWHATELAASVNAYGLEEPIPQDDMDNAVNSAVDPQAQATEQLTDLVLLDREQRASNLVFGASSYASANKTTLSGSAQWDNSASNPIAAITDAMDTMIMRSTF